MTLFVLSLVAVSILAVGASVGYHLGHQDGYDHGWRDGFAAPDPSWVPERQSDTTGVRVIGVLRPRVFDQDAPA